jgi:hypothetical protein
MGQDDAKPRKVEDLDNVEAVYTLYVATQENAKTDENPAGLDLDDPDRARQLVREALAEAGGEARAAQVLAMLENEDSAGEVARAALSVLREQPDLAGGAGEKVDELMHDPPTAEKLDFGLSLGIFAVASLAMTLMGTIKYESKTETKEGTTTTSFSFQGSEQAGSFATSLLSKLGLG